MTKTKTLTLLIASAALTAVLGLPAWSALHKVVEGSAATSLSSLFGSDQNAGLTIIAEGDDHETDGAAAAGNSSSGEDGDSCEEGEGNCGSAANPPPAAGSVPPPQNGLFGTAPAKVQVK